MDLFQDPPKYVIDTCSFIDLRVWYPPSIAQAVWDSLTGLFETRVAVSVEEVLEELREQDDRVFDWAKKHEQAFILPDSDLQRATKAILRGHPNLIDVKKRKSTADPFVIGAAQIFGAAVVTEEKPAGRNARPKIPNVCRILGIECLRIVEMFEREGFRFVLTSSPEGNYEGEVE